MKKILILLIIISNYSFGQEMNNEPQELLDLYLKSRNLTTNEYVKKYSIKSLYVLINNHHGYSKIDFDKNGNVTTYLLNGKRPIRKKEFKYDNLDRVIETKYFDKSENLLFGTFNIYKNDSILTYTLKDSILTEINSKSNYRTTEILYDENEREGIHLEKYSSDKGLLIKEVLTQSADKITKEYEYIDDSIFVTVIKNDSLNNEIRKERYLSEKRIPSKNQAEFYNEGNENPFKIETYENDRLISELYFDNSGSRYKEIIYQYSNSGVLIKMELVNYKTNKKIKYTFKSNGWLTDIKKKNKRNSFSYNFKVLLIEK